jgi:hypothetical protein
MIPNLSIPALFLLVVAVLGLFIAVRGFAMPKSFFMNQEKKEELRKILEKNKEQQENP